MDIAQGSIVIVKAGRGKGRAFAVTQVIDRRTALIADGKNRPIERPKRKNVLHLQPVNAAVDCFTTNRQLRTILKKFEVEA